MVAMEYVRGHAAFQSWLKWTVESQHAGAFPERAGLVEELEAVVVWRVVQEARQESLLGELQFSRNRVIARSLWHCEHKRKGKRLFANIVKVTIWWRFAATAGPNILQMNNGLKCESVIGMRCKAASNFKRKERMAEKIHQAWIRTWHQTNTNRKITVEMLETLMCLLCVWCLASARSFPLQHWVNIPLVRPLSPSASQPDVMFLGALQFQALPWFLDKNGIFHTVFAMKLSRVTTILQVVGKQLLRAA